MDDGHFGILGHVRACAGGNQVSLAERESTLLAVLLLNANELVDRDHLVDAIWGERPPRNARNQLQGCVSRLRKRLVTGGIPGGPIVTHQVGYELRIAPDALDLRRFRQGVDDARASAARGEHSVAVTTYRAALAEWRGPAMAGVESSLLRQAATGLDEERVRAAEERIELELALGAGGELVAELTELVAQHPYRERLHGALMRALYQDGRKADALAAYQRVRRLLVDEVGAEPGSMLRDLHQRILKEDQPLLPSSVPAVDVGGTVGPRRCLPRTVRDFAGRTDSVARLVEASQESPVSPVVLAIDGMAGIGKTTLAVHVAHLLVDRYPDAQLFIDLRGHSEHRPVEPATALDSLLRQVGVAGGRIPKELDERAALWRSELAERQVLVVLDNAASTAQVTPLLPAWPGCLVLVTSRRKLTGLDAAYPVSLDQLTADEAIAMLAGIVGDKVREQLEAAADVVRCCGYLPLAIRIAGTRLASRPTWRVADLASRLLGAGELLSELVAEDRTVANAFALSYSNLAADTQLFFRLLSLHPGEEFGAGAAAAMAECTLDEARGKLDDLIDRHLLAEPVAGRYRLHDLVREYVRHLVATTEDDRERCRAVELLLNYYLHASIASTASLAGMASGQTFDHGKAWRQDLAEAAGRNAGWLDAERHNLVAAVRAADALGYDHYTHQIAHAVWAFLYYRGFTDDLRETHLSGLAAAERLGDDKAIATICNYLASAHYRTGELERARDLLDRALTIRLRQGDWMGAAIARNNLALVTCRLGRIAESIVLYKCAMADWNLTRDPHGLVRPLQNLGLAYIYLGQYKQATRCHRRRLAASREAGDMAGMANALGGLGTTRCRLGEYDVSMRLLTASLRLHRRYGKREGELVVENDLGVLLRALGRNEEAIDRHRTAMAIALEVGDQSSVCIVQNDLARTLCEAGGTVAALAEHRASLAAATKVGFKYEQARALDGIAACLAPTDPEEARRHWELALVEYREMGVPERAEVERNLAVLASNRSRS